MRTFWLCDDNGELLRARGPLALPTEVWTHLYRTVLPREQWPNLRRLWREQWGPEAETHLTPEDVDALARELESLALFVDSDTPEEVLAFLDDLATLCVIGSAKRLGITVEAD